jgi:hypothetical protein
MSASKKSGQLTCYQTGQFYLLPTHKSKELTRDGKLTSMTHSKKNVLEHDLLNRHSQQVAGPNRLMETT